MDPANNDLLNQVQSPGLSSLGSLNQGSDTDAPPDNASHKVAERVETEEKTNILLQEDVEDRKADRALRDKFGEKAYKVARKSLYGWCWLLAIYAAIKFRFDKEIFSENVLIAITSAVTLNVFAAFLGVIRGLFPTSKTSKEKD